MPRIDPRIRRTHEDVLLAAASLLIEQGWDKVTHANVASAAGYSKATLYKHWPAPSDLVRAAFLHLGGMDHGEVTGDLRTDIITELEAWRTLLQTARMAAALAALAERSAADPALAEVRDQFMIDGQAPARGLIAKAIETGLLRVGSPVGPLTDMLSGALVYRIAILGERVDRDYVVSIVDALLRP